MTESKWTKGPWSVSGLPDDYPEAVNADGPVNICRVTQRTEMRENARLIAAAPDLAEACEAAMDVTNSAPDKAFPTPEEWRDCYRAQIEKVRNILRAALRKAKGEAWPTSA